MGRQGRKYIRHGCMASKKTDRQRKTAAGAHREREKPNKNEPKQETKKLCSHTHPYTSISSIALWRAASKETFARDSRFLSRTGASWQERSPLTKVYASRMCSRIMCIALHHDRCFMAGHEACHDVHQWEWAAGACYALRMAISGARDTSSQLCYSIRMLESR